MPNQFTRPWLNEELRFIQESIGKLTYKEMGRTINRSPSSIQSKIRYLPFQQRIRKHPINSNFFGKWSAEMAYVLGFFAADGNICRTGRAHMLHVACDDKDVIEKIKQVMNYQGPIREKVRLNGKVSYSLRISDPVLFNDLNILGVTERKSLTLMPPKIPKVFVWHFIRGYFDGDGSVVLRNTNYPSKLVVYFYTASHSMASFLHGFFINVLGELYKAKIGIKIAHQKTPFYVVCMGHKASVELFKYMYKDTNLFLERKYRKFLEGMN
ncbi:MAG TPA: LAGLIDADG family homing endonuclease [Candidatus Saccharimonadales bacterium]|nr:LAGLIDADG family homing endonuclease [Candidatus Saccharimonadales bacterium]